MTTDDEAPPETGGASSCHQISHDSHRPHRRLRITRLRAGLTHPALDSLDALGRFLRHVPGGSTADDHFLQAVAPEPDGESHHSVG